MKIWWQKRSGNARLVVISMYMSLNVSLFFVVWHVKVSFRKMGGGGGGRRGTYEEIGEGAGSACNSSAF